MDGRDGYELVVEQGGGVTVERFADRADLLAYQQAILCHWRDQRRLADTLPQATREEEP